MNAINHTSARFLWLVICLGIMNFAQSQEQANSLWLSGQLNAFATLDKTQTVVIETTDTRLVYEEETRSVNIGLGLKKLKPNQWFQEYSLIALDLKIDEETGNREIAGSGIIEPTTGRRKTVVGTHFRWEFGKMFTLSRSPRLQPGLSLSIDPFYRYTRIVPKTSAGFPARHHKFGAELRLIPRVEYALSDRLHLLLKIPIGINSFYVAQQKVDNPIVSEAERTANTINNNFGQGYFQIGLGMNYRL